jgi:PAS domain S-box-containing protein
MWITSEPLKVEDAKAALKKVVKNLDHFIKNGQIEILDYSEWYTKSGKFDANNVLQGWVEKENQALKRGYDGLRLSGNTFWLEKKDWRNFTDYEEEINNVIGKYRMIAICTYSLGQCGASEVIDVVSNHQFALIRREGKWVIIESSERKRAETALQATNKRLNYLLTATSVAIYTSKTSGDYGAISITENVKQIMGYEPREFIENPSFWIDHIHPEDRQRILNELPQIFEQGSYIYEYRFLHKEGMYRWVRDDMRLIKDEFENPIEIVGYWIDITERKRAEEVLRDSRNMLQTVLDSIPSAVFWKDRDSIYLGGNRTWLEALGLKSSEEVVGKSDYDLPWQKKAGGFVSGVRLEDYGIRYSRIRHYRALSPS